MLTREFLRLSEASRPACVSNELRAYLAGWRPRVCTADEWARVQSWVLDCVYQLRPRSTSAARRYAARLIRLAVWGESRGYAVDREVLLTPDRLEEYYVSALANDPNLREASASTWHSDLCRIARPLTVSAPWPKPRVGKRRPGIAAPYEPGELTRLSSALRVQATPVRTREAEVIWVLGLGCGLDGRWIPRVRADAVRRVGGVVVVSVSDPAPRLVVCRQAFEERLLALVASAPNELLFGGKPSKNRMSSAVTRLQLPKDCPGLDPRRLRSNWLVAHLNAGTPLPTLLRAAGMAGFDGLNGLIEYLDRPGVGGGLRQMRNVSG